MNLKQVASRPYSEPGERRRRRSTAEGEQRRRGVLTLKVIHRWMINNTAEIIPDLWNTVWRKQRELELSLCGEHKLLPLDLIWSQPLMEKHLKLERPPQSFILQTNKQNKLQFGGSIRGTFSSPAVSLPRRPIWLCLTARDTRLGGRSPLGGVPRARSCRAPLEKTSEWHLQHQKEVLVSLK